jgi:hypothetical protein
VVLVHPDGDSELPLKGLTGRQIDEALGNLESINGPPVEPQAPEKVV